MKNIYDVLSQKESELAQLQKEIEALRLAARLLSEEADRVEPISRSTGVVTGPVIAPSRPASPAAEPVAPWAETGLRQFP